MSTSREAANAVPGGRYKKFLHKSGVHGARRVPRENGYGEYLSRRVENCSRADLFRPSDEIVDELVSVGFEFERVAGLRVLDDRAILRRKLLHKSGGRRAVDDLI